MDEALKRIYAACNPNKPAESQYYVNFDSARGETGLTRHFMNHLQGASVTEGEYVSFLFSGHIGCGKSSELEHLRRLLRGSGSFQTAYLPILIDAEEYFDVYDVTVLDLMLAIVTETAATLREEVGYNLKDSYFKSRFLEIRQYLTSEVEINKAEIELLGAKLEVQRLKSSPDARQKVRNKLKEKEPRVLEEVNRVLGEARLAVRRPLQDAGRKPYDDIVLIFDNLERIQRFENQPQGLASQRDLFLERYSQLTQIEVHKIYTVPLRLVRSPDGPQLKQRYDHEPFVLPMVKVFERSTRKHYEPGIMAIKGMLEKRLTPLGLDDVIEPAALDFLLEYSGGHTRNLVGFVRTACTFAEGAPLTLRAVKSAVKPTVTTYSTSIPERHWENLAAL